MTDEELVAQALADLDVYTFSQQAQATAALLRMLPADVAAEFLREELLEALAETEQQRWGRYLQLEEHVLRRRRDALVASGWQMADAVLTTWRGEALWRELDIGDEPDPLRWFRARRGRVR